LFSLLYFPSFCLSFSSFVPFCCLPSHCICRYPHCLFRICRLLSLFISVYVLFHVFVLFSLTPVLIFYYYIMFHFVLQLFLLHSFILFGSASGASDGCCFSVCKMILCECKFLCR
jgi:hypothetical protein